jgi:hypothetical protein
MDQGPIAQVHPELDAETCLKPDVPHQRAELRDAHPEQAEARVKVVGEEAAVVRGSQHSSLVGPQQELDRGRQSTLAAHDAPAQSGRSPRVRNRGAPSPEGPAEDGRRLVDGLAQGNSANVTRGDWRPRHR